MAGKKILVVDDDEDILNLTVFSLKQAGYDVYSGKNGAEALKLVKQVQPDLIVLDVMMPILDGYHAASKISGDTALAPKPKIVLVTSRDVSQEGKLMEFAGADASIQKPFSSVKLLEIVKKVLS